MRRTCRLSALSLALGLALTLAAAAGAAPTRPDPGAGIGPPVIPFPKGQRLTAPDAGGPAAPRRAAPVTGKAYLMEMLQTPSLPPEFMERLKPLNTLSEIEALLKANRIPFAWRMGVVPVSSIQPDMVRQIEALPPREVFIAPQDGGWVMTVVLETREIPPQPAK